MEDDQRTTERREDGRADADDAAVEAHDVAAPSPLVVVPDERHGERDETARADALEKAQDDQLFERLRGDDARTGDAVQRQQRDEHPPPSDSVRDEADEGSEKDTRRGVGREYESDLRVGDGEDALQRR